MKGSLIALSKRCPSCMDGKPARPVKTPAKPDDITCDRCGRPFPPTHWRLRCYAGARTAGGNPRQASRQFRGTRSQAETALANFVTETTTDKDWHQHNATVADLLARWLEHSESRRAGYTMADYRGKIAKHILPVFGSVRLDKLGVAQLDRQYDAWSETLAPATVRKLHAILGAAFHQAVKWGWVKQSPTVRASPPSVRRADPGSLTSAQARALIAAAGKPGEMLPTAITLGALTGARRGELCALRWSDVDWATGDIWVRRSLTVLEGGKWEEGDTKTRKGRCVSVDDSALADLAKRRDYQAMSARLAGVELVNDPFVLSRALDGSRPCLPVGLSHDFQAVAAKLDLPFHLHSLRHYMATTGLAAGYDPVTVAGRAGHADSKMTLNTYGHQVPERARALARTMSEELGLPPVPVTVTSPTK